MAQDATVVNVVDVRAVSHALIRGLEHEIGTVQTIPISNPHIMCGSSMQRN